MGREREIGDLLERVVSGLRRDMGRHAGELALSPSDWAVLRRMYDDSLRYTPSTMDELCARVEMPREQVKQVVDSLEGRGLISRTGAGWRPTGDGDRRLLPLVAISESIMTKSTSGFTVSEMDDLAAMLRQMCANLGLKLDPEDER